MVFGSLNCNEGCDDCAERVFNRDGDAADAIKLLFRPFYNYTRSISGVKFVINVNDGTYVEKHSCNNSFLGYKTENNSIRT